MFLGRNLLIPNYLDRQKINLIRDSFYSLSMNTVSILCAEGLARVWGHIYEGQRELYYYYVKFRITILGALLLSCQNPDMHQLKKPCRTSSGILDLILVTKNHSLVPIPIRTVEFILQR